MDIVYLFCESDTVRIPFYKYDERLFRSLLAKGGAWDKASRQFIFRDIKSAGQFSQVFTDIPWVWIDEKASVPIRIFGFGEGTGKQRVNESLNQPESTSLSKATDDKPNLLSLPEKFPEHWRIKLEEELRSRKYSLRTQRAYMYYNRLLCQILQKSPEEIHPDDITRFLATIEKDKEYSASSINLAISALKFFYKTVIKMEIFFEQRRPRQDKRLPMVLAKSEIQNILGMEKNLKHRLLLMLSYSSGLRVSEVVTLKRDCIDLSRRVIYNRLGKGRKDRVTVLSEKAACLIREYYALYDIQTWLFPGQLSKRPLTIRSAQKIFDKAVQRADIKKEVSIHSLRHTFATHLLENGTDIRYIQALLGHSSLRTTERYTHIAQGSILNIQSPLDSIL